MLLCGGLQSPLLLPLELAFHILFYSSIHTPGVTHISPEPLHLLLGAVAEVWRHRAADLQVHPRMIWGMPLPRTQAVVCYLLSEVQ